MDLIELWAEWNNIGYLNQVGIFASLAGLILGIVGLFGVHMPYIDFFILSSCALFISVLLFVCGNIQQSRKLSAANVELSKVDDRIDEATKAVYAHKNKEIDTLEMDIAVLKDGAAKLQEEKSDAERLLQSERDIFATERTELIADLEWLHTELSRSREQKKRNGQPFRFIIDEVKQKGTYVMDSNIVDDRTPGEKRLGEIESKLKKYHV